MLIRRLKKEDIVPLVNIGALMHKQGSFKKIRYDKDKLFQVALSSINSNDKAWFVAEDEDGYIGMMGGFIGTFYFSHEKFAADYLIYIPENKRGGKAAIKLLNAFEEWAKEKGVSEIRVGTANGTKPKAVRKFYEWRKYDFIGYLLRKEL